MQPKYRSKLSTIQLVAIVKHKHLSMYGMDAMLRPFVDDMKKLVSVNLDGICMYIVRVDSRSGNFCAMQYFRILISCTSNTDIYTL